VQRAKKTTSTVRGKDSRNVTAEAETDFAHESALVTSAATKLYWQAFVRAVTIVKAAEM
jgi:hypothetical protein